MNEKSRPSPMEYVWSILSIACFVAGVTQTFTQGISKSYLFFIFSLAAFLMFYLRKMLRKSRDKE